MYKKIFTYLLCFILAFAFLYAQPKQKAHAFLPALVAGQFVKKSASKALASVLVRQGAKSGTVVTMKRAVDIAGSRMTPQQYAMFTGGLKKGVKSLDNKYVKIILGAELAGALGLLVGDMHDIATTGEKVPYNFEAIDPKTGLTVGQSIPMDLTGTSATNRKKFFTPPLLEFPGLTITGKIQANTWYPTLGAIFTGFDATNPAVLEGEPWTAQGIYRTWGLGYTNNNPTINFDLISITGIDAYHDGNLVRVNFYGQTPQGITASPGYIHFLNESTGNPGHLFMGNSMLTYAQWNDYYTNWLNKDPFFETVATINDFSKDETFIEQYPLTNPSTEVPNEFEYQIPNPNYWDLPGMEEAYYEQLQNFPGQTTVVDPNNYPVPGTETEEDIYGDGLPYSPGTIGQPWAPTVPGLDPNAPPDPGTTTDPITGEPIPNDPWKPNNGDGLNLDPLTKVGKALTNAFPFSLPWDIMRSVQAFNKPGQLPTWEIAIPNPITDTPVKQDFVFPSFVEPMARVVKAGLLLVFVIGLIYATRKLLGGAI